MSEYKHKSHNVSVRIYHFVCPAKYRRVVIDEEVDKIIKDTCLEISKRYDIDFLEIGTDRDHVHFLVQSVPTYSPSKIIQIIKSITAKEVFVKCPQVKKHGKRKLYKLFVNFGEGYQYSSKCVVKLFCV